MRYLNILLAVLFSSGYLLADSNTALPLRVISVVAADSARTYVPEAPAPEVAAPAPVYCFPDFKRWSFSPTRDTYYLNEATILSVKNNRYIKIWISRLINPDECTFQKEHVTIDCISNASGDDWYSVVPVDPDDGYYEVVKDICKAFPANKTPAKPKKK